MATDELFNIVGVSKNNGEYKVRFATDIMRIKNLAKSGHEDIRLCELDEAVTKYEAVKQIATMDEFQDAAAQDVISEYLESKAPKAAPKAKPTMESIKAKVAKAKAPAKVAVTEDEDAPF